jgi:hypothetical protein
MARKLTTYEAEDGNGYAEVYFDFREELPFIKYYTSDGKLFFTEEFPDKAIGYVYDAAENWACGIKKIFPETINSEMNEKHDEYSSST